MACNRVPPSGSEASVAEPCSAPRHSVLFRRDLASMGVKQPAAGGGGAGLDEASPPPRTGHAGRVARVGPPGLLDELDQAMVVDPEVALGLHPTRFCRGAGSGKTGRAGPSVRAVSRSRKESSECRGAEQGGGAAIWDRRRYSTTSVHAAKRSRRFFRARTNRWCTAFGVRSRCTARASIDWSSK